MDLSLDDARKMADNCLGIAAEMTLKPITVAVLDAAGDLKVLLRQDGTSTLRPDIAQGKARGAIALGMGSRAIYERAKEQPYFIQSMNALSGGSLVPVPGGVLIRRDGAILGAVGITGDTSDNDEACASRAIEAAGFVADAG
ncbi:MAG: GlcG/HbpS family heme-binding protein [Paracoccus sp. (in: a-proteobacteria)]|uniref:GlcG/HbpS family heme-binding protein n=1 Tax=unclassified Paracoccus (in: a-proteobacteria) TaxID=2688777 RepID=UPI000C426660|nr:MULTISPECIES: heme-binding protein [unclassified Paracoccus (in: a-proteobacteria)]MAN55118.1 GlcG protein [Paracoccus sp. (in: a-proteobacteria)]MBA48049.1 GlcG protein [Paracoccus sp. (in: a-proteobacteria)]MCS5602248.1 heme-binding protein [Paracoccus sp. (in: a-proteobacteria)]|tara:strand:- start:70 stop:495 length:426 start_codon:yes stop_codon:yes gene_type:complete